MSNEKKESLMYISDLRLSYSEILQNMWYAFVTTFACLFLVGIGAFVLLFKIIADIFGCLQELGQYLMLSGIAQFDKNGLIVHSPSEHGRTAESK